MTMYLYVAMFICMYMNICGHLFEHACICICMFAYVCVEYAYMYVYPCICMFLCVF